jgi:hypothetical protein
MNEELKKEWEREFDKKFPWLSSMKVTPNRGEDYEKARILQELVNKTNEDVKSFISSLLAKQQEEFMKCIPEEKETYENADSIGELEGEDSLDKYGKLHERVGFNQCIADIKSKLNI